jgi:signal transduction histidine kinase
LSDDLPRNARLARPHAKPRLHGRTSLGRPLAAVRRGGFRGGGPARQKHSIYSQRSARQFCEATFPRQNGTIADVTQARFRITESVAEIGALTGAGHGREAFIREILRHMLRMGFERARFWEVISDISLPETAVILVAREPTSGPGVEPGYIRAWSEADIAHSDDSFTPIVKETPTSNLTQIEKDLALAGRSRIEIPVTAATDTESILACDWRGPEELSLAERRILRLVGSQIGAHLALEPLRAIGISTKVRAAKPDRSPSDLVFATAKALGERLDAAATAVFAFTWPDQRLRKLRQFVARPYLAREKELGELIEEYSAGGPALTGCAFREPSLRQIASFAKLEPRIFVDNESFLWHSALLGEIRTVLYAVVGSLERRYLVRFMNRASAPNLPFLREGALLDAAIRDLRADVDAAISTQRLRSLQNISGLTVDNPQPRRVLNTIGKSLRAEGVDNFFAACHQRGGPQFAFADSFGDPWQGFTLDLDLRWEDDALYSGALANPLGVAVVSEYVDRSPMAMCLAERGFRAVLYQPMQAGQTEGVFFIGLQAAPPRAAGKTTDLPLDLGYGTSALIHAYSRLLANAVEMHHSQERVIGARRAYGLMGHEVRGPAAAVGSAGHDAVDAGLQAADALPDTEVRAKLTERLEEIEEDLKIAERRLGSALRLAKLVARESEGKLRLRFRARRLSPMLQNAAAEIARQVQEEPTGWSPFFSFNARARAIEPIVCDEDYIEEVVKNILLNAVKYSLPRRIQSRPGRQSVRILVNAIPQGEWLGLEITNWGWPIPPDNRNVIFEPWVRGYVEEDAEALAGMGLGLFLAKRLTVAHDGEILVSSDATPDLYVPPRSGMAPPGLPEIRETVNIHKTRFEIRIPKNLTEGVHTHVWSSTPASSDTKDED